MGLTYDGITYRSLEEQVRYDAEQVQFLKQADVTINESLRTVNENLQTVNTEINGKLTKPTNPSVESAVVIGADGTVSTKALSEFGGKLYIHNVILNANQFGNTDYKAYFSIYMTTIETITIQLLTDIAGGNSKYYYINGYIQNSSNSYTHSVRLSTQGSYLAVGVISSDGSNITEPTLFSGVDSDIVYEL